MSWFEMEEITQRTIDTMFYRLQNGINEIYGSMRETIIDGNKLWLITTGGWSENEELISEIQRDFKQEWNLCWFREERGGRFWLEYIKLK